MKQSNSFFFLLIWMLCFIHIRSDAQIPYDQQWPGFRGPQACGFLENVQTPVVWDMDSLKNIKWKTAVPGLGHSCPVIWDDRLFVTTASSENNG